MPCVRQDSNLLPPDSKSGALSRWATGAYPAVYALIGCLVGVEPTTTRSTIWRSTAELQAPSTDGAQYTANDSMKSILNRGFSCRRAVKKIIHTNYGISLSAWRNTGPAAKWKIPNRCTVYDTVLYAFPNGKRHFSLKTLLKNGTRVQFLTLKDGTFNINAGIPFFINRKNLSSVH